MLKTAPAAAQTAKPARFSWRTNPGMPPPCLFFGKPFFAVVVQPGTLLCADALPPLSLQNRFCGAAACTVAVLWRRRWMSTGVSLPACGDSLNRGGRWIDPASAGRASRTRFSDSCFFVLRACARGQAGRPVKARLAEHSTAFSIPTFSRFDPTFSRLVLHFPGAIHRLGRQISGFSFA